MELQSVLDFLERKTILVTGATGFLAKVFVEKILRVQPDVNKVYLLLRASNTDLAKQRLQHEVIGKDLFRMLHDKWGVNFDSFISKKIVAVAGDVSLESFGIRNGTLKEMHEDIDVIVNFAAATRFDERFDVSMGVNTLGAVHVLNFAKHCHKLQNFLHVSTAFVCGEAYDEVVVQEEPFQMGQTLKGNLKLDIEGERNLLERKIHELEKAEKVDERTIKSAMKEYGMKRAKLYGWPNTYVFTKAMGEMLLVHFKDNVPLIIIRPTIVLSTYNEPFPGYIEGLRTIDSVIGGYGKGKLKCFLGHSNTIVDAIPADMVINCMITAMVAHSISNEASKNFKIYHICSSSKNPLTLSNLVDISYHYFTKNPLINNNEKPIILSNALRLLTSMSSFHRYITIRYLLPLKGLKLVNIMFCQRYQDVYSLNRRKIKLMIHMVELYKPYAIFKAIFNDTNAQILLEATMGNWQDIGWNFDANIIDWTDYLMNAHIPGLIKYVMN